jgi:hypothetical protein
MLSPLNGEQVAMARPNSLANIRLYIGPQDGEPNPLQVATHDRYWGNFIEPVHRLFKNGIATPSPGDVVTVMVYLPPYKARSASDWDASPHNPKWFKVSPWVPDRPYNPSARKDEQGKHGRDRPTLPGARPKPKPGPPPEVSEDRLDHEILMLTTDANDGPYFRRPGREDHYLDIIHDLPRRCVFGRQDILDPDLEPLMKDVLVKLLIVRDEEDLLDYLATGTWSGDKAIHLLDAKSEDEVKRAGITLETTWDFYARGKPPPRFLPLWEQLPSIDRRHVKIHRLDYIGHSGEEGWFLQYGILNQKGEIPGGEVIVTAADLIGALANGPKPHFTHDAVSQLWGCHLGFEEQPGNASAPEPCMARTLTEVIPKVIAADTLTDFTHIIDGTDSTMPTPIEGGTFQVFTN